MPSRKALTHTPPAGGRKDDLKSLPLADVQTILGSSPEGLSQAEATQRLATYGPNEIAEHKTNASLKFLTYFWGPIPWMIEAAVVLSGLAGHWPDFFIILVLLVANGVIGFWEEHQAGNAIDALKAKLAIKARVRRDGAWITHPAAPGPARRPAGAPPPGPARRGRPHPASRAAENVTRLAQRFTGQV